MNDETYLLMQQIERCHRLAGVTTDDDIRHSLEQLAKEYEAQLLRRRGEGFMLQPEHPVRPRPTSNAG
jgi:hypothetical protein